jgi:predicted  nucleic acid-binding Zn-ribbon protein
MAYVNAAIEPIVNAIQAGTMTIEQGQSYFANLISVAEATVKEDENDIKITEEGIKAMEDALETLKKESEWLSNQISDLRWEETSAHRDGDASSETSAQTMADYYEQRRDELNAQIQDLNKEKDNLYGVKYDEEKKLDADRRNLDRIHTCKQEFDSHCENDIRPANNRLGAQADSLSGK